MENLICVVLTILCTILSYLFMHAWSEKSKRIHRLETELLEEKFRNEDLLKKLNMAYLENGALRNAQTDMTKRIPKGTIEAVRYAMIHSHPDNGGSSEKFILYKECYEELTK